MCCLRSVARCSLPIRRCSTFHSSVRESQLPFYRVHWIFCTMFLAGHEALLHHLPLGCFVFPFLKESLKPALTFHGSGKNSPPSCFHSESQTFGPSTLYMVFLLSFSTIFFVRLCFLVIPVHWEFYYEWMLNFVKHISTPCGSHLFYWNCILQ